MWRSAMAFNSPGEPFSVPDPLAGDWDDMVRRNRLLQAQNDPLSFEDADAMQPAPDPLPDALNDDSLPFADWLTLRAQQLAGDPAARTTDSALTSANSLTPVNGGEDPNTDEGLGIRANAGQPAPHDNTGFWQLGAEWLTGRGPRHHDFGPDDPATQILRQHDHIQSIRDKIASAPPPVGLSQKGDYDLSGLKGVPEFLKDYSAIPTNGATGNLAAAYLGSYPLSYAVRNIDNAGVATVDFKARSPSSMASALHIPYAGYLPSVQPRVDGVINGLFPRGPGSPTSQTFTWSERIPLRTGATGTK